MPSQIDTEHGVPIRLSHLDDRLHQITDTRVVHHDVEASIVRHRLCDEFGDLRLFEHIAHETDRLAAGRTDLRNDLLHFLR